MGVWAGWAAAVGGRGRVFFAPLALLGLSLSIQVAARPAADAAPAVAAVFPAPGAAGVALGAAMDGTLAVTFSEPVALAAGAVELACERSEVHALAGGGGPVAWSFVSERPFWPGERCVVTVQAEGVSDLDADDPPDGMGSRYAWSFTTAGAPVVINELDAIWPGGAGEFIELYDGGRGHTPLDGLTVVLYRGDEAAVYLAVELDGRATDGAGYFVLGGGGVAGANLRLADGTLRDGPDAVAVYAAPKSDFPRNAPVSPANLVDAAVYGPADGELLALLAAGQAALDEDGRGAAASDSSQRCPNGGGKPRETAAFIQNTPTPGAANNCRYDEPPAVAAVAPKPGAVDVALDASLQVTFSEPVVLAEQPFEIACEASGVHAYDVAGGPEVFSVTLREPLAHGERCVNTVMADKARDADEDDPPDVLTSRYTWSFETIARVADNVIINEVDADTPGVDAAEFIELFDGGAGNTPLDGLSVVLFNGTDDRSYLAMGLDGRRTNAAGYFLLGNGGVTGAGLEFPAGALQNGPDAVALVAGKPADFPNGTPAAAVRPLDALVYGRAGQIDDGLLPLLNAGQPQVDEAGGGDIEGHSNQRCPNGAGGTRNTAGYKQNRPTPGTANDCVTDAAPEVVEFSPGKGAQGVSISAAIGVSFNEPVAVTSKWITLKCAASGTHTFKTTGGPTQFTVTPNESFGYTESCTVTLNPDAITDQDADDPPDKLAAKLSWSFTTGGAPADFLVINEIDADTPGTDAAEFIELFDGGRGRTPLDGLAVVLFNGSNSLSYRAIDLDGFKTDEQGYFFLGNSAVAPDLPLPDGFLQNGSDAAALYAADAAQFPTDSPIVLPGLLDAIVYGDPADGPPDLLALLVAGQKAVDEGERGAADSHSLQRCPDGGGGQRKTESYQPNPPTAGAANRCAVDAAPLVTGTIPVEGAQDIPVYSSITVTFSEPVVIAAGSIRLICGTLGALAIEIDGGPVSFNVKPAAPLPQHSACRLTVSAVGVSDVDGDDPPDRMAGDFELAFATGGAAADFVLINEIDADTPGTDAAEFIELFDGGRGNTALSGLVLVLFNGSDDKSYRVVDLSGLSTGGDGFAVIGSKGVPGVGLELPAGSLQNGADAVALYAGLPNSFPNGTALHTRGLLDALVYGTGDPVDAGLLALLETGQPQVDEAGNGPADQVSIGRCPDGGGGPRRTDEYRPDPPSPGGANRCQVVEDAPPSVAAVTPTDGEARVPVDSAVRIRFSEAVTLSPGWFAIDCATSGAHTATVGGDSIEKVLQPREPFSPGESCTVKVEADLVRDADDQDPPDLMVADFQSAFQTQPNAPEPLLINEIDADTSDRDAAEFIELFDGGRGRLALDGLVMVWWNGKTDMAYRVIDLSGRKTDEDGYFIVGSAGVDPDIAVGSGALQNGPDAIALYAGDAAGFAVGMPLTTAGLVDAVVYGPGGSPDAGLLPLLEPGEPQVAEDSRGEPEAHSLSRCPNGAGDPRRTTGYRPGDPSPRSANACSAADEGPGIASVFPPDGRADIPLSASLVITFTEDVGLDEGWLALSCGDATRALDISGGPRLFTASPHEALAPETECMATVNAAAVHDTDAIDPPDHLSANYAWTFTTAGEETPDPPVAGFLSNGPVWIGEAAIFTNTSTGPGPLAYRWDFGDGHPPAGATHPTHVYPRMGTYTVTLTVTGPTGTDTTRQTIDVRPRRLYLGVVVR